jgi:hypothetical protein
MATDTFYKHQLLYQYTSISFTQASDADSLQFKSAPCRSGLDDQAVFSLGVYVVRWSGCFLLVRIFL